MQLFRRFYKIAKMPKVDELAGNSPKTLEEKLSECGMSNKEWQELLKTEYGEDALNELMDKVEVMYKEGKIGNPEMSKIFGFTNTGTANILPNEVRVVILGQDPSGNEQGLGYGFGTVDAPSLSLKKIFECIKKEYKYPDEFIPTGKLDGWIRQGVLLLNSCPVLIGDEYIKNGGLLDFKKKLEKITISVIRGVLKKNKNIFFILMGTPAKDMLKKIREIDIKNRVDLFHPAWPSYPVNSSRKDQLYAIFYGKEPFTKANARLLEIHKEIGNPINEFIKIDWKQF